MIPTFNCANYLRQTLESVLAQDPGPEQMQIEVVDDCSTKDDPEAVVKEVGKGRVNFYRKPKNEGAIPNFNTCIERSRGELVHILHGDDYILPGFYEEIGNCVTEHKDCNLYATRTFFVTYDGILTGITERMEGFEKTPSSNMQEYNGNLEAWDYGVRNPLQFAGIVIRRTFYEKYAGFDTRLVHTADMEMWHRAVMNGKCIILPQVLSAYRCFEGNDTSKLMKSAENLRDLHRVVLKLALTDSSYNGGQAVKNLINKAYQQFNFFNSKGDIIAAHNVEIFIEERTPPKTPLQLLTMKLALRSRIKKIFVR
jgi:glycosyltransferase involved in cell wall biosynthesis